MLKTALLAAVLSAGQGPDEPLRLDAGPLVIEIAIAPTANLFHVVDQLAEWSPYCHRQYGRYFRSDGGGLSPLDEELLAQHAAVRAERSWGAGLEQTFYTSLLLEAALERGIAEGHLTVEQAAIERAVLEHFAERVERLAEVEHERLIAFRARIQAELPHLRELAGKLSRFCHGARPTVPVYLIPNPVERDCGGGFNGGRLALEIPHAFDVYPTFLHEILHSFVSEEWDRLGAAAAAVEGLDRETLNEGLAYALAPGIIHPGGESSDPLLDKVVSDIGRELTLADPYARFHRFGLALRPLVREALDDPEQTLATFLPRAVDAWKVLNALEAARTSPLPKGQGYRQPGALPSVFILSDGSFDHVLARIAERKCNKWGRSHRRASYDEMFENYTKADDQMVLVLALDGAGRVPQGFEDLLPEPWADIESRLAGGATVELSGRARELAVVVLAAPKTSDLPALIGRTKLLHP